jgi:heat shock protein HtpX
VVFDRVKPESYWDEFFVDLLVMLLPLFGFLAGLALFVTLGVTLGQWHFGWLGVGVALMGLGGVLKTRFKYARGLFPHLTVAALMGHVKVSPVRPVPVTLTGRIIGKGVPGLIWSEDFVIQDPTGILFLDYQQPLGLWNWLFGLLRAGRYQDKEVRVEGWFRRAPTPYLEINRLEVVDGSEPSRNCYTSWAALFGYVFLAVLGIVGAAAAWLA